MAASDSVKVLERMVQNEKRRADKAQKDLEKVESTFNERVSNLEKKSLKRKGSDDDDDDYEEDLPTVPRFLCNGCKIFENNIWFGILYIVISFSAALGFWGNEEEEEN